MNSFHFRISRWGEPVNFDIKEPLAEHKFDLGAGRVIRAFQNLHPIANYSDLRNAIISVFSVGGSSRYRFNTAVASPPCLRIAS